MAADAGFIVIKTGTNPSEVVIACGTAVSVSIQREQRDTTCKGTSKYRTSAPGFITGSVNFTGLWDTSQTNGLDSLITALKADSTIDFVVEHNNGTATSIFDGSGYVTEINLEAGEPGSNATYGGTITISGEFNAA